MARSPIVSAEGTRLPGAGAEERYACVDDRPGQPLVARPRIGPVFGWLKTIGWLRKVKLRGLANVDWLLVFASAAFNLIRLPKLLPQPA